MLKRAASCSASPQPMKKAAVGVRFRASSFTPGGRQPWHVQIPSLSSVAGTCAPAGKLKLAKQALKYACRSLLLPCLST